MIEERLREYAGDETPPSRLFAEEVYRHARTTQGRRRAAAVTGAAVLTALALAGVAFAQPGRGIPGQTAASPPAPSAPLSPGPVLSPLPPVAPGCTVAPVSDEAGPMPFGVMSLTADPTGRYIIGSGFPGGAALWVDGHRQALPDAFHPAAVNASGTIAGTDDMERAAVVRNGTMTNLPTPSGSESLWVTAINARGDVVGGVRVDDGGHRAVLWPAAGGYKVFSDPVSTALAIADDGTVYGTVSMVPTRWTPGGKGTPLPLPPGYHTGWAGYPSGDQLFGEVASGRPGADPEGDSKGELAGERIYVRWHLGSGTVEQIGHPESGLYPTSGTVYPATVDTVGVSGTIVATVYGKTLLYRGNTPVALPQYQGRNMWIRWVSADGHTILGVAHAPSDQSAVAVIWTGC